MTRPAGERRAPAAIVAGALLAAACGGDPPAPAAGPARAGTPSPGLAPERGAPPPELPAFALTDVADAAGLRHPAWCGRPDKPHLLESGGNGVALIDHDADGLLDVYVVTGWRLAGEEVVERPPNRLYRNLGGMRFEDVTEKAGVGDTGWGAGAAVGDVDGDGRPDLLVTNFGPDVLYRNRGDGTFERVAGFAGIDGWSASACFFDADGDGDDDLFVCGYVDCTLDDVLRAKPTLDWKSTKVMFGPFGLEGLADRFFRNDGGTLVEATAAAGLTDVGEYFGFGVAAVDFDGDLDVDLFVANDSNPNYVYVNDGKGRFQETGLWCGAAVPRSGTSQAGMGIAVGDPDADGRPDVFVTTFADDVSSCYRNLGRALFRDVTNEFGLREPTYASLSWGTAFADLDLDGDEDVYVASGHIYPQADTTPGTGTTYAMRNLVLENRLVPDGGARFRDATAGAGPGAQVVLSSRGLAAGDLDDDGDVDLVVSNVDAPPTLLRNDVAGRADAARRRWLVVDAPHALRVAVEAGGRRQVRHRVRGGSFQSESDPRFHFGLGGSAAATVTVTGADGRETVLRDVRADQVLRVPRLR